MNGGFIPAGLSGLGSTDNAIVRTNGTAGTSAQGSLVTIDDAGYITPAGITGSAGGALLFPSADVLNLRNGVNGQRLKIFNTYTDDSTGEFFDINWSGNTLFLEASKNGTGTSRDFWIGTGGSSALILYTGASPRWTVDTSGNFLCTNGTADTTIRIGAASGTGGGVLDLNISASAPSPVSGHVQICYLTGGINFDRPLIGVGSGLTSVPGAMTIDPGWTGNADAGTKTAIIASTASIFGFGAALDLLAPGAGAALVATAEKCKALESALALLLVPNA